MLKKMWIQASVLALCAGSAAAGTPANDHCSSAQAITAANTPLAFNNTGADSDGYSESSDLAFGGQLDHTLWYTYTPSLTGLADVHFCNSGTDVYFTATFFDACDGEEIHGGVISEFLSPCGDQFGKRISVTENESIIIMVGSTGSIGFGGFEGAGVLNIDEIGVPENDLCADAEPIGPGTHNYSTLLATADIAQEVCYHYTALDVWYSYTAQSYGTLLALGHFDYPTNRLQLSTYDTCGGPVQDCFDTIGYERYIDIEPGQSMLIRIATYNNPDDQHGPGSFTLTEVPPPANDTCNGAATISLGVTVNYDTYGSRREPQAVCLGSFPSRDIYYTFVAPKSGSYTVRGTGDEGPGGRYLPEFVIYSSCTGAPLVCSRQDGTDYVATYDFTAGQQVYIRLATDLWNTGNFSITAPSCAADFNNDNTRDVADLFAYINAWLAKTANADFNDDSNVDVADLFAYINAWLAGC